MESRLWGLITNIYFYYFFFFNDTATTEIYTLSLHDALPISLVFVTRKGRKVFYLTIANALLEDPAEIDAFLQPFLERFDREHF